MRKRRLLAVLLALSLSVSGNGMTVLAAENPVAPMAESGTAAPDTTIPEEPGTPELTGISFEGIQNGKVSLEAGENKTLKVVCLPDGAKLPEEAVVAWTSTDAELEEKIVSVVEGTAQAEVKALKEGNATVTVTVTVADAQQPEEKKTYSAECEVTVTAKAEETPEAPALTGIILGTEAISLKAGEEQALPEVKAAPEGVVLPTDAQIAWESLNTEVAVVTDGRVKAVAAGDTRLKVTVKSGEGAEKTYSYAAECSVTVAADETDKKDENQKPEGTEEPDDSRDVTFTDDTGMKVTYDANAAMKYIYVVENGVLTAVRSKTTDAEGKEVTATVTFAGNVELRQPEEGEKYTSIAKSVFSGNQDITYVKLPAGIQTIAAEAFKGCTALKGIYLPAGVNNIENSAFENCTAMTQISLPKSVVSLGDGAFRGDTKLYMVNMKDADYSELKTIGANAFAGCSVLSQFCSHSAFALPVKLESIGEGAFQNCKAIKKLDFTANKKLTTIGAHVFSGCTGLTDLMPGKTLTAIPEGAFAGCIKLVNVNFENGANMTIGKEAFKGCYQLKQLALPQSVVGIGEYAFQGCTKLVQVEIKCYNITIEPKAFPQDAENLVIVAEKDSNGYLYALENNLKIPAATAYYKYTVEDVDGVLISNGSFPGGKLWVGTGTQTEEKTNVNTLNQKKGVKSGELCYIYYSQTEEQKKNFTFIAASLRCNGKTMQKKDGKYYFEMPVGGAVITAEFRANTPDTIKGQKVTVEFSNGTPLQNGRTDEYGCLGVELRVGQTSRIFLLDEDGSPIPASKLVAVKSDNEKVVKIDKNGVITAAGTEGKERADATVTLQVKGGDGSKITINRTISVTTAKAESIILKASDYSSLVKISGEADGIQTASIKKNVVRAEALSFKLKASIYDGEEGISKKLTWTTSDAKVATLKTDTTTAADPVNVVTVQKNCQGEATITVTAQNPSGSEKDKITQKFVVQVFEEGYRLTNSKVTVNPRMTSGGYVELISAYGIGLEEATLQLYEEKRLATTKFTAEYVAEESSEVSRKFRIVPVSTAIESGTYNVRVGVNGDTNEKDLMPLTITVKRSKPDPKIEFNTKKAKFNLFYVNGGTNSKGETISVLTKISGLGDDKIRKVALEPLTEKEDDRLFTENFVIDEAESDLAKGNVVIKRSGKYLQYTSKQKAALTGYLVIYYDGYDDTATKKVKVTMPTHTQAPEWALKTEQGSYRAGLTSAQEVSLVLYDKASKKKEQVVLDESYSVTEQKGEIALSEEGPRIADGAIAVKFFPDNGKMELVLRSTGWDMTKSGKERTMKFTYKVKVSSAKPTVKANKTVSVNVNYPESAAQFKLVSNPTGLQIDPNQTFTPVVTEKNASEIARLWVTYENGEGRVGIKSGQTVKKGTYKFECMPKADEQGLKKVTLTVKVVDGKPTVKLGKTSLQLNKAVYDNNKVMNENNSSADGAGGDTTAAKDAQAVLYRETSEVTFKVSGKPDGYTLAPVGSGSQETTITCSTKNKGGAEKYFTFNVEEDSEKEEQSILRVALKDKNLQTGTYKFKMTPRYLKAGVTTVSAKPVSFNVKVISTDDIYMTVKTKGKINLVNREGEQSHKNGIVYTPALKNIVGEIEDVKIYDASSLDEESKYFDISMISEGKNKGKFFVTPKKIVKESQNPDDPVEYTYAELKNNKSYAVRIWAKVKGYAGDAKTKGGVLSKTIRIKTAQVLPETTTDKKKMDVFLSTKNYDASFIVKPKKGSVGIVEEVYFAEKDELANDSFTLIQTPQEDGSLKVTVHLKDAVGIANGTTANVKFYVKYKGQGTNTSKKARSVTMKIKVN